MLNLEGNKGIKLVKPQEGVKTNYAYFLWCLTVINTQGIKCLNC